MTCCEVDGGLRDALTERTATPGGLVLIAAIFLPAADGQQAVPEDLAFKMVRDRTSGSSAIPPYDSVSAPGGEQSPTQYGTVGWLLLALLRRPDTYRETTAIGD
jgi:hypothetical protein